MSDPKLVEHVAQKLYEHRFCDEGKPWPGAKSWREMKTFDPRFAQIYRDNAVAALKAVRSYAA